MIRLLLIAVVAAVAVAAGAWWLLRPPALPPFDGPLVAVPSGAEVRYADTVQTAPGAGLVYRFRFVAPGITRGGGETPETAQADMQALCDSFALPRIPSTGPQPGQIVISLSDRPVKFGAATPEAVQFFEAYRPEAGRCVWEMF